MKKTKRYLGLFFAYLLCTIAVWFIAFMLFWNTAIDFDRPSLDVLPNSALSVLGMMTGGSPIIASCLAFLFWGMQKNIYNLWRGWKYSELSTFLKAILEILMYLLPPAFAVFAFFANFRWQWNWFVLLAIWGAMLFCSVLLALVHGFPRNISKKI